MNTYEIQRLINFRFEEDFGNIRSNLLGTGKLYEDTYFYYNLQSGMKWRRPKEISNNPVFINHTPSRFDALQGNVADCYFASAVIAITLNDRVIKHVVPQDQAFNNNYIGAFHFRFWRLGTWVDVVVDDRLPTYVKYPNKLCYMHSQSGNVFWAALLEKAYAKLYDKSYEALNDGFAITSYQDLSGGIVESLRLHNLPFQITAEWLLKEVFSNKSFATCFTYDPSYVKDGLTGRHSYTITKMYKFPKDHLYFAEQVILRLMNPYGFNELDTTWRDWDYDKWHKLNGHELIEIGVQWQEDGEFWLSLEDFVTHFQIIHLCYLGPGQYISMHRISTSTQFSDWNIRILFGEWVNPYSAAGSDIESRHKNPQLIIELECTKHSDDGKCPSLVVIELSHRSKKGRTYRPLMAFFVYYLKPSKKITLPLRKKFFKNNIPIDPEPEFKGRAYVAPMKLQNGRYCIVPCTQEGKKESYFCLRIYSEGRVSSQSFFTGTIGKSAPTDEAKKDEPDHELRARFGNAARGRDELDCIGLKELLDDILIPKNIYLSIAVMSINFANAIFGIHIPNISLTGIFTTLIHAVFGLYFPLMSSKTDDMVFTKNECRSMIAMLDYDHSGKLSFSEFINLWKKICFWKKVYYQHRDEAKGYVTVSQFRDAISSIGYNIPHRTVHSLSYVYADDDGNISLTDFILCGVTLETVTSLGQKKNLNNGNDITMKSEDWVKNTLIL